jgi:hypothetical protein
MHMEMTIDRTGGEERSAASLPECISALLARIGHRSEPAALSRTEQLSHLGALELLEQHGCFGEWRYGRIEAIAAERFPVILQCGDGGYCVLLAPPRGGKAFTVLPEDCGPVCQCGAEAIQSIHGALYLLCQPSKGNVQEASAPARHWCFGALGLFD